MTGPPRPNPDLARRLLKLAAEPDFEGLPLAEQDRLFDLVALLEPRAMRLLRESPRLSPREQAARWALIWPPRVSPSLQ